MLRQTPSQTVGPFFHACLVRAGQNVLVDAETRGQRVSILGAVYDGQGRPVPDALVEIWQADANGHFNHPADPHQVEADRHFSGFGRSGTDEHGAFTFQTVKPGAVMAADGALSAPYINIRVFARGMLIHALTRLYFSDESANAGDPVLGAIGDPARRLTLLAVPQAAGAAPAYRFDIHLQGERETVFFEP